MFYIKNIDRKSKILNFKISKFKLMNKTKYFIIQTNYRNTRKALYYIFENTPEIPLIVYNLLWINIKFR